MKKEIDVIKLQLSNYKEIVGNKRVIYINNLDTYNNFIFKLCDKYKLEDISTLKELNYVDYDKVLSLRNAMIQSEIEYIKSLRDLYNFKVIVCDTCKEYGVIYDFMSIEERKKLLKNQVPLKRSYRPSRV